MSELIPDTFYREGGRKFGYVLSIQGVRSGRIDNNRCWGVVTTFVDGLAPVGRFIAVLSFEMTSEELARDLFLSLPASFLDELAESSQGFSPIIFPAWALKTISNSRKRSNDFTYPQPEGQTKELIRSQKDLFEQARVRMAVAHFRAHRQSQEAAGIFSSPDISFAKLYELFRIFGVKSISEACEVELQLTKDSMQVSDWPVLVTRLKRYGLISGR